MRPVPIRTKTGDSHRFGEIGSNRGMSRAEPFDEDRPDPGWESGRPGQARPSVPRPGRDAIVDRLPRNGRKATGWAPRIEGLERRALMAAVGPPVSAPPVPLEPPLTAQDVNTLLDRASMATASNDAII